MCLSFLWGEVFKVNKRLVLILTTEFSDNYTHTFKSFFFTFTWPCIVKKFLHKKPTRCTNFTNYFVMKLYMFRTVCLSIIRSLFTVHSAIVYVIQVCRQLSSRTRTEVPSWSCSKAVYTPVGHTLLLSVQWINSWCWTDELSEICRVSRQNKFVKIVHLVGFIIKKRHLIAVHVLTQCTCWFLPFSNQRRLLL